ncbi:MAG: helix-turn-helix transcriptional regulator [Clostridia bacterium]|nr:helix-turn-helix transcriptional regulator [Clostridia bacterium]
MKNRLHELRSEQKLHQEQLAKAIDCSQQLISNYETGKLKRLPADLEEKICDYFNCSIDYLRCRTNIRNEKRYSQTLIKIESIIEGFYSNSEGNRKSQQDLTDEELANFQEILSRFKDILQKFPKL